MKLEISFASRRIVSRPIN